MCEISKFYSLGPDYFVVFSEIFAQVVAFCFLFVGANAFFVFLNSVRFALHVECSAVVFEDGVFEENGWYIENEFLGTR